MTSLGRFSFGVAVFTILALGIVVAEQSVTQILAKNGLPSGLLPATVESYTLAENGKFEVKLRSTCTIKVSSQEVSYKKTITGELSYGKIKNLGGIQVHVIFWLSVSSIEIDGTDPNTIWFKVGYISKSLSIDYFLVAPVCNSLGEEGAEDDSVSLTEWLRKAMDGTLDVNLPHSLDFGAARNLLQ